MEEKTKKVETFKKGDIVDIQYVEKGSRTTKTLERAEVLSCDGNNLKVGFRSTPLKDGVEFVERSFDMSSPDFIGAQCVK